jgi:hypothetical protein
MGTSWVVAQGAMCGRGEQAVEQTHNCGPGKVGLLKATWARSEHKVRSRTKRLHPQACSQPSHTRGIHSKVITAFVLRRCTHHFFSKRKQPGKK